MKRSLLTIKILFVLVILLVVSFYIPTPYLLIKPGNAEDLARLIEVEGSEKNNRGTFYLVTVAQQEASLFWLVHGYFSPYIDVAHVSSVIPPEIDQEEYRKIMDRLMEESQTLAKVIALERTGYQIELKSAGIVVHDFIEGSPAAGVLQKEDIIRRVDGEGVYFAEQVNSIIQKRKVGDSVNLSVERDNQMLELQVKTTAHPENPETPALRIYIYALALEPVLPFDITINTGPIGGSSAGVMFVLEIMNQVMDGDLSGDRLIAGTGTISYDEKVGKIGGVKQKVAAAEREGAEYFIVPRENYSEAKSAARNINVHPVDNLQDVLDLLASINMARSYDQGFCSPVRLVA